MSRKYRRSDEGFSLGQRTGRVALYLALCGLGALVIAPLLWLVSNSLQPEGQVYAYPTQWIPRPVRFSTYAEVMDSFPFWRSTWNTMLVVTGAMVGHLFTCSLTAYAFARIRFPLRDALFVMVLATMMIPYHVYLIPRYLLFVEWNWLSSLKPLIVPHLLGQAPFYIFLMRQFFRMIPKEYDDAARIDGCGWLDIYWRIVLPLSNPVLGAVAILTFIAQWNDFLAPLLYLSMSFTASDPEKQTLAVAINTWLYLYVDAKPPSWNQIMAVSVLMTLPPTLVFFFAQRRFIQGVVMTGIKG